MSEADYIQLVLKHLDSQAGPAEQAALQSWLEADPQNRLEYQALEKIWSDSGRTLTAQTFDVEAALEKVGRRLTFEASGIMTAAEALTPAEAPIPGTASADASPMTGAQPIPMSVIPAAAHAPAPARVFPWKRALAAASVLLIAGSAGWWYLNHTGTSRTSIHAETANQSITLPDGSLIHLRKGSTLSYSANDRTAELSGEAFFEPKPDASKPFRIRTGRALYQDIGTSFLVNDQLKSDELTVITGKVKFSEKANPSNSLILMAGQKALLSGSSFTTVMPAGDPNVLAWKTDVLDFKDQSLSDVAADITDYYQTAIVIDPALAEKARTIRVTARFEHQPLKEVLEEVRLMTGLSTRKEKDTFVLTEQSSVPRH
jgi:transmembrane sensor